MCCAHRFGEFHIFERNLTKATTASPCAGFGFTAYDKTETHGFGPVSMTLDLYNKPSLGAAADTVMYTLEGVSSTGDCAQFSLPSADVRAAQQVDANLKVGTCASVGYSVADGTASKSVPVLGTLTIYKYKKEASVVVPTLAFKTTHYEAPTPSGCRADEGIIRLQGISGDFCAPRCSSASSCPSDVPAGVTATPQCVLQDASIHTRYCALVCDPSSTDSQCGEGASCKSIQGSESGVCTYDDFMSTLLT